jgi:C-terminal processing protease CtpA/Prc
MKRSRKGVPLGGLFAGVFLVMFFVLSSHPVMAEKNQEKGYLGVSVEKLSIDELKEMNLTHGIRVAEVIQGEAADQAGMKENDVIQYVEKEIIHSPGDLVDSVRNTQPGTKVKIKLVREKKTQWITVTMGKLKKKSFGFRWPGKKCHFVFIDEGAYLGIHIQKLNNQLADYFGVKPDQGVLILEVVKDSPAQKAGLKAGDVILFMEKKKMAEPEDIHEFLSDFKKGNKIEVSIMRNQKKKTVTVILGERTGHGKWDILKWKKGDKCVIEVPEILIPEFHVEIPDIDGCRVIIHENLERAKKKLERVKEKVQKKLKGIKACIYI